MKGALEMEPLSLRGSVEGPQGELLHWGPWKIC